MKGFIESTLKSKTGIFGIITIVLGLVGLIPVVGGGVSFELISLGIAMITLRHAIYKQDVQRLDPVLDRMLGDQMSGITQEILIKLLEAKDEEEIKSVKKELDSLKQQ